MEEFELEFKRDVLVEIQDHLQSLTDLLESQSKEDLSEEAFHSHLFRILHSIKGISRSGDFDHLSELTHKFENLLFDVKSHTLDFNESLKELILSYSDTVSKQVEILLKDSELEQKMNFSLIEQELEKFLNTPKETQGVVDHKKLSILAIDDEQGVLDVLNDFLTSEFDAEVVLCLDGEAGRQEANKRKFNVIFSDYQMPKLNGLQFLEDLRDHATSPNTRTPVLILTGLKPTIPKDERVIDRTYFLEKPFNFKELEFYTKVAIKEGQS